MEAYEAIMTRRSIRLYEPGEVSEETVRKLLEAAMSAPSAGNEQPWEFIVIRERENMLAIREAHPHAPMLDKAALAIAVCGNKRREKYKNYWVLDCSAATQNILLAAHALGLGAVWLGVYPNEERLGPITRLLGLPEGVVPLSIVAVGHPGEEKPRANRFDEGRIHAEKW